MIDTHIHIDEEAYAVDREEVIARQREAGVEAMIVPGVNAKSIEGILDVCQRHKGYCFPALGFHPQDVFPEDYKAQWAVCPRRLLPLTGRTWLARSSESSVRSCTPLASRPCCAKVNS